MIGVTDVGICGIWQFMKLLVKLGAAFTFSAVNFDCVGMYTGAELLQCQILPALYSWPWVLLYPCNYFDFFIIIHIFKDACMDLLMSLAMVAPSISTQMFIQKCQPSIMHTFFHSLFLIYELN